MIQAKLNVRIPCTQLTSSLCCLETSKRCDHFGSARVYACAYAFLRLSMRDAHVHACVFISVSLSLSLSLYLGQRAREKVISSISFTRYTDSRCELFTIDTEILYKSESMF